jgi:hypothetical protein
MQLVKTTGHYYTNREDTNIWSGQTGQPHSERSSENKKIVNNKF